MTNLDLFTTEQNAVYEAYRRIDFILECEFHRALEAEESYQLGQAILAMQEANVSSCAEVINDLGPLQENIDDLESWLSNAFAEYTDALRGQL